MSGFEHIELRKPAEVKNHVVYVFDSYGVVSSDTEDYLQRWIEGVPPNWQVYASYWHEVDWKNRYSVRCRSRAVTRQRQRRNW